MKRDEFLQCGIAGKVVVDSKPYVNTALSEANPLHAQSVREKLTRPLPITPRPINYSEGVLSKDMQPFDKMYADKLEVFNAATAASEDGKNMLRKLPKEPSIPPVEEK